MDAESKKQFRRILIKAKTDALLKHELDFLRARQSYLSKKQIKEYGKLLKATKAEKKERADRKLVDVEQAEEVADEANRLAHPAIKDEGRVPYRKLQARAKKLKLKFVGVSRKELEESIIKAEAKPLKEAGKDAKKEKGK